MKYRVELEAHKIDKPNKIKEIIAFNAQNAIEIAETYNKGYSAIKAIRIGKDTVSTEQTLKDMVDVMNLAIQDGNTEIYEQQKHSFEETVKSLKSHMNVISWNKTKKLIPEMPVM